MARAPIVIEPKVLAMVLSVRIEEIVSSRLVLSCSRIAPWRGRVFFNDSTSETVVLRTMASISEQMNEIPRVRKIAVANSSMA